jgi:hypothetical protein
MRTEADRRRQLLRAALGFALLGSAPVSTWLGTWRGIGLVAAGMARQGYDLSLTRYANWGWRATFYVTGREHSPTGASGSAFAPTPQRAVHAAAWETLART